MKERPTGRRTKLRFRTNRQTAQTKKRNRWIIFLVAFLLVAGASFAAIWNNFGLGDRLQNNKADPGTTTMKSEVNILLGGSSTEGELVFLTRIHLDTGSGGVKIKAYDPDPYNTLYGGEDADAVSEEQVARSFRNDNGETIDRFIFVKEPNAANLGYLLGGAEVTVAQDIDYSGDDFSLHMMKGDRELTGADLFNLLRYYGLDKGYSAQEKLLASYIEQVINVDNMEDGQHLFERFSNNVDTNISISDYSNYAPFLEHFAKRSGHVGIG